MESSLSLSTHHPLSSPVVNPSPKRGPGRPPKAKPDPAQPTSDGGPQAQLTRKRGRPPKQAQSQSQAHVQPGPSPARKRPGRPPKQVVPFGQPVQAAASVVGEGADDVRVKRQAGRPPKLSVVRPNGPAGSGRPRGRPKKSALGVAARPIAKRGRGRPKGGGGVAAAAAVAAGKRRGRPPKGGVSAAVPRMKKPRRVSGKPLGRPRKDAAAARSLKFEHAKANEELTAKLELIQVKIREVLGIVRPYVADANEALVALQQLEEVAMTAPPTDPPAEPEPESGSADPSLTAPPPEPAPMSGPYYGVPGTFSVNLPALDATEPLHMGGSGISIEGQHAAMGWIPSGGAQS